MSKYSASILRDECSRQTAVPSGGGVTTRRLLRARARTAKLRFTTLTYAAQCTNTCSYAQPPPVNSDCPCPAKAKDTCCAKQCQGAVFVTRVPLLWCPGGLQPCLCLGATGGLSSDCCAVCCCLRHPHQTDGPASHPYKEPLHLYSPSVHTPPSARILPKHLRRALDPRPQPAYPASPGHLHVPQSSWLRALTPPRALST
jgi:hypothetical protein